MRVINLQVENFKRLTAVDITPAGDVVTITGKNMQGKSSVLDALWGALEGAAVLPTEAIRQGAERARLRVDLGQYIVTRTISKKKDGGETTAVKVENADGAVFPSPQKLLDGLIGKLSFDPLLFSRLSETPQGKRQQFDMLAKFVPGIDFELVANLNRGAFDKRAEVNRRAKEARAAAGIIMVPAEIPEKVDEKPLLEQLAGASKREAEIAELDRRKAAIDERLRKTGAEIDELEAQRKAMAERLTFMERRAAELRSVCEACCDEAAAVPPAPERIDTQRVAAQLNDAQRQNRCIDDAVRMTAQRDSMVRLADSLDAEAQGLTDAIAARLEAKAKAISAAKMPVEGVGFGDGEILLNGVPFSQGSSAEQLRTSVAIAAALNPTLRVIHIRDGSLLDEDSKAWLASYAAEHDLQCWVEVVGTDSKVGVLIEDGHVKTAEVAA